MKKLLLLLAVLIGAVSVNAQHLGTQYRLKKVIPVAGRQGIAIDDKYYYVSDTKVLYKYDKEGNLIMKNDQPFQHPEIANHFGDIDVWSRNSNTDVVSTLPYQFMMPRHCNGSVTFLGVRNRDRLRFPVLLLTVKEIWYGCRTGLTAAMCIATALRQDNTIQRCSAVLLRTGVRVFSSLTARCCSLPTTVSQCIRFQTISMLPISAKFNSLA